MIGVCVSISAGHTTAVFTQARTAMHACVSCNEWVMISVPTAVDEKEGSWHAPLAHSHWL